jgi:hypothetical protein
MDRAASQAVTGGGGLARLRRRTPWPRGEGGDVRISPVAFPICLHFPQPMIGLGVPPLAKCEPDKSQHHQDSAGCHQPMWILHAEPS